MMEDRKRVPRRRVAHPGALALVGLMAIVIITGVVLNNNRWVVRTIEVQGRRLYTEQQVIDIAGIRRGDAMLSLKPDEIAKRVNADRYLEYVAVVRQWPDHVLLEVIEHSPAALLYRQGMMVMIDANGFVLEQTAQMSVSLAIPLIVGLDVTAVPMGQLLRVETPARLETALAVLEALQAQGLSMQIEELNVSALDNLYLVMANGLQVMLGNDQNIQDKLLALSASLPQLHAMGQVLVGAVLDVSAGDRADYRPPRQ
ncbi:MAG: FtsQ-type POTRA domain-containing protein [Oscillospiraceae bacterium]|jgi:cell division protein FtsQ|nr:FtsQ-type POTRA domain-containing protein [Oscillospiraceae bacterium]